MILSIGVLDGDGIGPEISSVVKVLNATALSVESVELPVGLTAYEEYGSSIPDETPEGLKTVDGWFLGPVLSGHYPDDDPGGGNPSSRS